MSIAGNQWAQFQVTWNTGSVYTNPSGTSWSTGNGSIATVNNSGTLTGQSPGQTTTTAILECYPVYSQNCSGDMRGGCPDANIGIGGPVYVAMCFAQLKYRSILGGEAQHTFWYVQDSNQVQYIIDGGPSDSCAPNCGYLNDWLR
jgi:hypothetical protein